MSSSSATPRGLLFVVSAPSGTGKTTVVDRLVVIDTGPEPEEEDLGTTAGLGYLPVIGEALWRVKPDFAVRDGLEIAFAPGCG